MAIVRIEESKEGKAPGDVMESKATPGSSLQQPVFVLSSKRMYRLRIILLQKDNIKFPIKEIVGVKVLRGNGPPVELPIVWKSENGRCEFVAELNPLILFESANQSSSRGNNGRQEKLVLGISMLIKETKGSGHFSVSHAVMVTIDNQDVNNENGQTSSGEGESRVQKLPESDEHQNVNENGRTSSSQEKSYKQQFPESENYLHTSSIFFGQLTLDINK